MNFAPNNDYVELGPNRPDGLEENDGDMRFAIINNGAANGGIRPHESGADIGANVTEIQPQDPVMGQVVADGEMANSGAVTEGGGPFNRVFGIAKHDPFDINSYPITNPPIFDSTMMLPCMMDDGIRRRRRVSISNGQIGQIVNHEAFFFDSDTVDDELPMSARDHTVESVTLQPPMKVEYLRVVPSPRPSKPHAQPQKPDPSDSRLLLSNQVPVPQQQHAHADLPSFPTGGPPNAVAGVPPPNHQLIYNNEVIYNPDNGPIPGTAVWKKERLLERNRLAASKCRQRKKHAQKRLQDNVSKYEEQITDLTDKVNGYEELLRNYKLVISNHLDNCSSTAELKRLIESNDPPPTE